MQLDDVNAQVLVLERDSGVVVASPTPMIGTLLDSMGVTSSPGM
jgi:hypothetical protein